MLQVYLNGWLIYMLGTWIKVRVDNLFQVVEKNIDFHLKEVLESKHVFPLFV